MKTAEPTSERLMTIYLPQLKEGISTSAFLTFIPSIHSVCPVFNSLNSLMYATMLDVRVATIPVK